ncbi:MAG: hypothetical protein JRI77_12780 [Deltaproteobacteria bacterium]|nr:hypothetical protein [Deltaproteobacteria bacterium]
MNSPFTGAASLDGGPKAAPGGAALLHNLVQSSKACDINPRKYIDEMLRRTISHPAHRVPGVLPKQWRPTHSQACVTRHLFRS